MKHTVLNGIDRLDVLDKLFTGQRLGLVTGGAATDKNLTPCVDVLCRRYNVTALFNTILGIRGEYISGERVPFYVDAPTGLPVYSIFSKECVSPTEEMLKNVDIVVFDIKEAGVRFYEYLACAANVLKGCAALGKPLVVLDRAAPINALAVEGTVCPPTMHTVVADYELPTRIGLTMGEFCRYVNGAYGIGCDLTVLEAQGFKRHMYYDETDLPWVLPSPSLPSVDANLLYAGMCIFEGISSISEGRGTTRPFELIGAPWMDAAEITRRMRKHDLPGLKIGPTFFKPTYSTHAGILCQGVQLAVLDRTHFESVRTALTLLDEIRTLHGEHIEWRDCSIGHDVHEPESAPVFDRYIDKLLADSDYSNGLLNADGLIQKHAAARAAYCIKKAAYHLYE